MSQVPNPKVPADASPLPAAPPTDAVHRPAGDTEEVYYEGTPRLRGYLGHCFIYGLLGVLFIFLPILLKWFKLFEGMKWYVNVALVVIGLILLVVPLLIVKRTRYRITNYRIDFERGWLSTTIDTTELWHVEDIKFYQSIFDRMLSVGTIMVYSRDATDPSLYLHGIPNAHQLFNTLKQRVIAVKRQSGVLKIDPGLMK